MRWILLFILSVAVGGAADLPTVAELNKRYARDDARLSSCVRYERKKDGLHEQMWELETGDVLKIARETRSENSDVLEEFSIDQFTPYFVFRKTTERKEGVARVTEERTYSANFNLIEKTRRTADFPAGAAAEIPAKAPLEKVDLKSLSGDERCGARDNEAAGTLMDELHDPKLVVFDPAKDAPAEWKRIKLVEQSLSPDGRYALAITPDKNEFNWNEFSMKSPRDFQITSEGVTPLNFIAGLRTHTIVGRTLGEYFGTKQSYGHFACIMAWSPDSQYFIQLMTAKWTYDGCCIGRINEGKVDAMENLGEAAEKKAKQFLVAGKDRAYRRHKDKMEIALHAPQVGNDGIGSIDVVFQVPKSTEDDTLVEVSVRFRLKGNKLEILGAE